VTTLEGSTPAARLAEQVADLGRRLRYASDDDAEATELAVEAAVLVAAADAQRARPAALSDVFRTHGPAEQAEARARTLRAWLARRAELVADSLSTAELAARLGISPAAVTKRRTARRLLAFRAKSDWRYPTWQLRPDGTALPGAVEAWQALPLDDRDPVTMVSWFTTESAHLGSTPLATLLAGEPDRVVDAASYVGGW
jgi:hypothetical protein